MNDRPQLAVDISALQVDGYADRGIGRYVAGQVAALAESGRVAAALLSPELPPPSGLPGGLVRDDLIRWNCLAETRRLTAGGRCLAYHVPAPFLHSGPGEPAALGAPRHWAETGVPRVVTLHDLIPLRAPRHYLAAPGHEDRYRARARIVAGADLIVTNSAYTRSEAIELLGCHPDSVVTVGAGVSPYFSPADGSDDALWKFHLGALEGRPYALTVGGSDERKNMERLVDAVGLLAARGWDLDLVVVGDLTADWRRRLHDRAAAAGVEGRLHLTGPVSDELLRACYRHALVSVMPSLAEGSGLPVLESAACGVPALASSTTALVETTASPLARFDPTSPDSMAEALARIAGDDGLRRDVLEAQQRLASQQTWTAVGERTAAALDALAGRSSPTRWKPARPAPSLALAGPLAPLGGGIGVYNHRLLSSLPRGVRANAVVPGTVIPDVPAGALYRPMDGCGHDYLPSWFDAVVYTLGNSAGHLATVEMALVHPGWLWLHEARLPAVATTAMESLPDDEFGSRLAALLRRAYPGRPPLAAARRAGRSNLDLVTAGIGLLGPLAERCRGILVNSQVARRLVELDLSPLAWHPPIHVLPPACPPVSPRAGRRSGSGEPIVVAFGVVSMSKRPDLLVDAIARTGHRLAFVGPCPPILAQVIRERAGLRGVEDRVEVCDSVDEAGWRDWMDRAALAVQLRGVTGGEISAALLEAMAAGLPVLTNVASAADLPEGTVSYLHDLDEEAVASRIGSLVESPAALDSLAEAGIAFAAEHSFARLGSELLSIVAGDVPVP